MGVWLESCKDEMECCIVELYTYESTPRLTTHCILPVGRAVVIRRVITMIIPLEHQLRTCRQPHTLAVTAFVASTSIRFA